MAASMAESMRAIGLQPLSADATWQAFDAAGSSPCLIRAKLDISRFCSVKQARTAWPFLDRLKQAPEVCTSHGALMHLWRQLVDAAWSSATCT